MLCKSTWCNALSALKCNVNIESYYDQYCSQILTINSCDCDVLNQYTWSLINWKVLNAVYRLLFPSVAILRWRSRYQEPKQLQPGEEDHQEEEPARKKQHTDGMIGM